MDDRRAPIGPLIAIGVVASAAGIALGLLIDWFPVQGSTQADDIDTFYDVLIIASVPMFVLVVSVVLYCVYYFRVRPGWEDRDGPPIHGNTRLEVIWTVIPAVMMLGLCTYAYVVLANAEEAPAAGQEELNVRVVGEQFTWTFYYPPHEAGGEELASNQLYLPVNRSVYFKVQTKDVLHDFWVPEFRWKIDAVPGVDTGYRVTPTRRGVYPVVCAELCGLGHAVMRQSAHVVSEDEFTDWLAEARREREEGITGGGEGGGGEPTAAAGKQVFQAAGCGGCHALADAGAAGGIGPDLDRTLEGADEAYIREGIVEPDATIAEGFTAGVMPSNYDDTLAPADIDALVTYLQETVSE